MGAERRAMMREGRTFDKPNQVSPGGTQDTMPRAQPDIPTVSTDKSMLQQLKDALTPQSEMQRRAKRDQSLKPQTWT